MPLKKITQLVKFEDMVEQNKIYLRLLHYLRPYWWMFLLGLLSAIPYGAMDGAIAYLAGQGLQRIFVEGNQKLIYFVPLAVLIIASSQGIFRFFETFCIRYVGSAAIKDLRNELFAHLEKQPLLFFQTQSSGILIGRMVNDIAIIETAIAQTFQSLVSRTITVICLATVLIFQSWTLSIIAISILSCIVLPVSILGRKIRKSARGGQEAIGDLVSVLSESIQGAKIVQAFNLQRYQSQRFKQTNFAFFANTIRAVRAEAMLSPILAIIGAIGIACVMWVAGYQVMHHKMTLGSLTSFVIALLLLYSPLKNIGRINGILQPALAAAKRVFDLLDLESNLQETKNAMPLVGRSHHLQFINVNYHYPTHEELVLHDINIDVPPGRMIALVGLSGSGKTTLANLVPRFFDPTSGVIMLDDIPLVNYSLFSIRQQIALVTQDNFLFNMSIEENIRLGRLDATESEIIAAAQAAYCHDFILNLSHGYKTKIGERGVKLSGGQQQRIAIARAILKDAPILILDEATSSLDNESEAMVQAALDNLMKDRTVIVIAHRLSTVRHADEILVLENGRIVESGNHNNLVSRDSVYGRLIKAQFERPLIESEPIA
jgi:subfamily B ATP-binding cassette protein MsbA